jgi:DNA-binding response OmpR family regulator
MIPPKTKILCVEDDPVSGELLGRLLEPLGCELFKAGSGREALEVIARENIDLVLLDVVMPGMDGYEVCKAIKGVERTRNIPVIMITGLISKEDRIRGIEAGAEEFLTKPFDATEVLARVKMLLKVKNLNEMRTGKILIELGLINEQQLQEALKISKEKNIKVGEALYSMGALSMDTIYWGLSNQLQMTYIELSPDMVNKDLIQKFPLDVLKRLQCLPLYETNAEIHFAIADPTDQKNVDAIKSLRPGKAILLHLGLPEKIADILNYYERETLPPPSSEKRLFPRRPVSFSPADGIESREVSDSGKSWDDLVGALLSMAPAAVYWLYRTPRECRLLGRKGSTFELVHEYPAEVYSGFQERAGPGPSTRLRRGRTMMVLSDRSNDRRAALKISRIDAMDGGLFRIERLPVFSAEAFERSHPLAPHLMAEIKGLFEEHRRLVVGGPDKFFIKQLCYSLLVKYFHPVDFPPVFFIESEADIYLPEAAQLSGLEWDLGSFLKNLGEEVAPFVFNEAGSGETESVEASLSGFLSGRLNNIILYLPSASAEAMREALAKYKDRPQGGFRAVFIEASRLTPIGRERPDHA